MAAVHLGLSQISLICNLYDKAILVKCHTFPELSCSELSNEVYRNLNS